jgi:hypothetical protein
MSVTKLRLSGVLGVPKPVLSTSSQPPTSLGHQNIIQQANASLMKKSRSPKKVFDEMTVTARDEPVCRRIEKVLQPIFASTRTFSQMDCCAQLAGFAIHEEVGIPDFGFDRSPMMPDMRGILSFEGEQYRLLLESFGAVTFSPSIDYFGYSANKLICEPTHWVPAETQNGPGAQAEEGPE